MSNLAIRLKFIFFHRPNCVRRRHLNRDFHHLNCGCRLNLNYGFRRCNCCPNCGLNSTRNFLKTNCFCCNCRLTNCSCCLTSRFCCSCRCLSCFCLCLTRRSARSLAGAHIPNWSAKDGCCSARCNFGVHRFGCPCGRCCCLKDGWPWHCPCVRWCLPSGGCQWWVC